MRRSFFTWLLLCSCLFALAACCGSVSCDCAGRPDDAIYFRFNLRNTATARAFTAADVDTTYFVRYARPDTTFRPPKASVPETVRIIRASSDTSKTLTQPIVLNNSTPFASANNLQLDGYAYSLYIVHRAAGSAPDTVRYYMGDVQVAGRYNADGCCTCYTNYNKRLRLTRGVLPPSVRTYTGINAAALTSGELENVTEAEGSSSVKPVVLNP